MTARILIVEDVDTLREVLCSVLESQGYSAVGVSDTDSALHLLEREPFSCVLSDFKLKGRDGLALLSEVRSKGLELPFLLMTAYGTLDIAVEALRSGANNLLLKPFEPEALLKAVGEALPKGQAAVPYQLPTRKIVSKVPAMAEILRQAEKVARVGSSVLILGESGTGKELVARFVHENSPRARGPFIAINCGAIPESLLESELFGHEEGAFTGATQSREGIFELGEGGTVFLDEIGEMSPHLQVKLLRVLQEREFRRVGGSRLLKADVRIVAATNLDIQRALESRILREDLYYRLAIITLNLPPLRARRDDIPLLAEHFLLTFNSQFSRSVYLNDEAKEYLESYHWPGNVRELENTIERAVLLHEGEVGVTHLGLPALSIEAVREAASTLHQVAEYAAHKAEADLIARTLAITEGNKSRAARMLNVSYKTLLHKVREYNL